MPNWIEGTMKLRVKRDDISRFIREGIHGYDFLGENEIPKNEYLRDSSTENELYCEIYNDPHIDGTRRMFITETNAWMGIEEGVCCFNVKAAWAFIANDGDKDRLIAIADKYNVDIRLYGIESGMEFVEEVIVHHGHGSEKGKIVLDNCINYEDWNWDCPFPDLGG